MIIRFTNNISHNLTEMSIIMSITVLKATTNLHKTDHKQKKPLHKLKLCHNHWIE